MRYVPSRRCAGLHVSLFSALLTAGFVVFVPHAVARAADQPEALLCGLHGWLGDACALAPR